MKEKTISLEDLANQFADMYKLKLNGFMSKEEFEGARFLIKMLAGERYEEVCNMAESIFKSR